jgi:hypothetical protein
LHLLRYGAGRGERPTHKKLKGKKRGMVMRNLNLNKETSLLNNERGTILLSNALVSGLMVAVLVLFGETVATCYQYLSLQHSLNEGLRAGIVRVANSENPDEELSPEEQALARQEVAARKVQEVANALNVDNKNNKRSAFVNGTKLNELSLASPASAKGVRVVAERIDSDGSPASTNTKWIEIKITKRLDFSNVLALISRNSANNRGFNFDFYGKAKIQ